jgi:hypothetical protein
MFNMETNIGQLHIPTVHAGGRVCTAFRLPELKTSPVVICPLFSTCAQHVFSYRTVLSTLERST